MASFCPRCGHYADTSLVYCHGCGGNIETLRQTLPIFDRLSLLGQSGSQDRGHSPVASGSKPVLSADDALPPAQIDVEQIDVEKTPSTAPDLSLDISADLSFDEAAPPDAGGIDFSSLVSSPGDGGLSAPASSSSGELDFSALGGGDSTGSEVFDLDGGLGGIDFGTLDDPGPPQDSGTAPTLSFEPASMGDSFGDSSSPGGDSVPFDLDAQLGTASTDGAPDAGGLDFSALGSASSSGLPSGDIDFSNLSALDSSQSGDGTADALDLSLSNFGGGLGELDFSSLVQDTSAGGAGTPDDAIDFSGLSSIDIAPPPSSSGSINAGERPADDVVYDLDLDMGATNAGGLDLGFGFDEKDMSEMGDDLLKASMISYKPSKD